MSLTIPLGSPRFVPGKRKLVRRSHRKNHGLISFKEIAQVTADNWKTVDTQTFDFVTKAAKIISDRYKEIEQALGAAPTATVIPTTHGMMSVNVAPPVAYHHQFLEAPGVYAGPAAHHAAVHAGHAAVAAARPKKARAKKSKPKSKKAGDEPPTGEPLGLDDAEGFWNHGGPPLHNEASLSAAARAGSLTLAAPPGTAMEGRTLNLPNINANAFGVGANINVYKAAYQSSLNGMVQQMHAGHQANAFARGMPGMPGAMSGAPDSNPFLFNSPYYHGLASANAHQAMNYPGYPGMPQSNPNSMYLPPGGLHGAVNGMNAMQAYGAASAPWTANQGGMLGNNIHPSMSSRGGPDLNSRTVSEFSNSVHTLPSSNYPNSPGPGFHARNQTRNVPDHTMPGAAPNHHTLDYSNLARLNGGAAAAAPAPPQLNVADASADKTKGKAADESTHTLDYSESSGDGEETTGNGEKTDAAVGSAHVAINDSDILHMLKKED